MTARKYPLPEVNNEDLMNCELCDAAVFECDASGRCPNCEQHGERWAGLKCAACSAHLSDEPGAVRASDNKDGTPRYYCESCTDEDEV